MSSDFADWLSPMLVKELRQGMRSRALLISLFLVQGLLILNVIAGFGASNDQAIAAITGFFWTIVALPMIFIIPLSAMGTIGQEMKANTLDLVFLTRLGARRIVFGKWIAVVTQSVLIASTIIPYLALRYYLGGVDVLADLRTLGWLLVGSAVFSSVTVALSAYPSKLMKVLLGIGFFFSLQSLSMGLLYLTGMGGAGIFSGRSGGAEFVALILLLPIFVLLMLEVGVLRIAPAAENHSGACRLLVLLAVLITGVASLFTARGDWIIIVGQVLATPFLIAALCEAPPSVAGVFRSLARRGRLGNVLAWIFTPGWHTGVLFFLLLWVFIGVFWQQAGWLDFEDDPRQWLSLMGFGASLLLPAMIARSFSEKRFFLFVAIYAFCIVAWIVMTVVGAATGSTGLSTLLTFLPPVAVAAPAFDNVKPLPALASMVVLTLALLAVYPFKSLAVWRHSRKLQKVAMGQVYRIPAE